MPKIIHIERAAPFKPAAGQPCNGCGVCCLVEPCPLGQLLSGRRHGACTALRWQDSPAQYRCGALQAPADVLQAALPGGLGRWLGAALAPLLRRWAGRWIAAGQGCDSTLEVEMAPQTDRQSEP